MNVNWKITDESGTQTDDNQSLWISFDLDQAISKVSKTYTSSTEATHSPIASKLFGFPWVDSITINTNSILIKRQDWVDFDIIAEPLKELIGEHFSNDQATYEENPEPATAPIEEVDLSNYSEQEALVVKFLTEDVNPQVASHGGKISFVKLDNTSVHLKMEGGCQGCGMAAVTLKEGVEKSLIEQFDFISEVIDTTDHASGIRPYL